MLDAICDIFVDVSDEDLYDFMFWEGIQDKKSVDKPCFFFIADSIRAEKEIIFGTLEAFYVFDWDWTGFISKTELIWVLMNFCEMKEVEAEWLIE